MKAAAEFNSNFGPFDLKKHRRRGRKKDHPPEVLALANQYLAEKVVKFKAKLDAKTTIKSRNGYYGILVAVSIHQALVRLGYIDMSKAQRKAGYTKHAMLSMRAKIGKMAATPSTEPCQVAQANLDGI